MVRRDRGSTATEPSARWRGHRAERLSEVGVTILFSHTLGSLPCFLFLIEVTKFTF